MKPRRVIFAAMGGSVAVAVSYDPKVEAFMQEIGRPTLQDLRMKKFGKK